MKKTSPGPDVTALTPEVRDLMATLPILAQGRLLCADDLGAVFGIEAESVLKRLHRGGDLPKCTRIAGRPRWAPLDVAEFLAQRRAA